VESPSLFPPVSRRPPCLRVDGPGILGQAPTVRREGQAASTRPGRSSGFTTRKGLEGTIQAQALQFFHAVQADEH
jgi:hypothetical protein